ncbi:glycogen synthase [Geothrix limicola]|uniref:Glycogen synthase n=1 Tax=Geothrix limicola TaxID=2927978 RepID=A0ABQ5QEE0_9BACT|nr:glycogen synthase GlgA [Geothrix limicola]GLH73007.1 glycogen synthase [Geothrix limicola]
MRVLFVASELFPYVKTGGLGDVMAALPRALRALGADVRMLVPAYPALREALDLQGQAAAFPNLMGGGPARIYRAEAPGLPLYLLDQPAFFDKTGSPYGHPDDLPQRFAALAWAAAHLGRAGDAEGWRPDLLHGHDWPVGLMPAYVAYGAGPRPATVMTIHNIAYQGRFAAALLPELQLPRHAFTPEGVEFHGDIGFLKAGLRLADRISTVSPTYAREIQVADGYGLEGLLSHRNGELRGILNGVDRAVWNPATDPGLVSRYDAANLDRRGPNRRDFQIRMDLDEDAGAPLFAAISRLDPLKGLDLVLDNVDHLVSRGAQLAIIGTGDPHAEGAFRQAAQRHPGRVGVFTAYDEILAHRAFAAADVILVPSRQEPCGLTQLYAQAYGALPLVRRTGGLADTVVGATPHTLADDTATGFVFDKANGWALGEAINQALALFQHPAAWRQVQRRGMMTEFGWAGPAKAYLDLYATIPAKGH